MDEDPLIGGWTLQRLRDRTSAERYEVWRKARALGTAEARKLMRAIEDLGLPYVDPKALKADDPITLRMRDIIFSHAGTQACLKAQAHGLPAIAGVDPILSKVLGADYCADNHATNRAGVLVGELMRMRGFQQAGERSLPKECVAKTGMTWS